MTRFVAALIASVPLASAQHACCHKHIGCGPDRQCLDPHDTHRWDYNCTLSKCNCEGFCGHIWCPGTYPPTVAPTPATPQPTHSPTPAPPPTPSPTPPPTLSPTPVPPPTPGQCCHDCNATTGEERQCMDIHDWCQRQDRCILNCTGKWCPGVPTIAPTVSPTPAPPTRSPTPAPPTFSPTPSGPGYCCEDQIPCGNKSACVEEEPCECCQSKDICTNRCHWKWCPEDLNEDLLSV